MEIVGKIVTIYQHYDYKLEIDFEGSADEEKTLFKEKLSKDELWVIYQCCIEQKVVKVTVNSKYELLRIEE